MSTDRDITRTVWSWLKTDGHESADRVLGIVLDRLDTTPQRRATVWPARRLATMNTTLKLGLGATIVAVVALIGFNYLAGQDVGGPGPGESTSPSEPTTPPEPSLAAPSSDGRLPRLRLPSTRGGPPGEYGWEGAPGDSSGMHRVAGDAEVMAMFFGAGPSCLETSADQQPVAVRVAGLEGVMVEPYEPAVMFNNVGDEITRAYALDVDGTTLCVFVTWHPTTSDRDRAGAFDILDSLRAELRVGPTGQKRIRITFTLRDTWDTG